MNESYVCVEGHDFMPPVAGTSRTSFFGKRTFVAITFCRRCGLSAIEWLGFKTVFPE